MTLHTNCRGQINDTNCLIHHPNWCGQIHHTRILDPSRSEWPWFLMMIITSVFIGKAPSSQAETHPHIHTTRTNTKTDRHDMNTAIHWHSHTSVRTHTETSMMHTHTHAHSTRSSVSLLGADTLRGDGAARAVRRNGPCCIQCVAWMGHKCFQYTHTHWMQHGLLRLMARAAPSPGWIQKPFSSTAHPLDRAISKQNVVQLTVWSSKT